eukprot:325855-Chlamydomonas_euryale.AAC.1
MGYSGRGGGGVGSTCRTRGNAEARQRARAATRHGCRFRAAGAGAESLVLLHAAGAMLLEQGTRVLLEQGTKKGKKKKEKGLALVHARTRGDACWACQPFRQGCIADVGSELDTRNPRC